MTARQKIESELNGFLDELDKIEDLSEVLVLKAKLECLKIASEIVVKIKTADESAVNLPSFKIS